MLPLATDTKSANTTYYLTIIYLNDASDLLGDVPYARRNVPVSFNEGLNALAALTIDRADYADEEDCCDNIFLTASNGQILSAQIDTDRDIFKVPVFHASLTNLPVDLETITTRRDNIAAGKVWAINLEGDGQWVPRSELDAESNASDVSSSS